MTITAAVDGSSLGNPGPAGWAWVVDADHWDAGGWPEGTNNLGELTAVLELLKATEAAGRADEELHILADSRYAIDVISKWRHGWKKRGWKKADKQPIKNLELIREIDRVIEGRAVRFEWVKGHAGHWLNELADDRARGCAEAYRAGTVPSPGPGLSGARTKRDEDDRAPSRASQADDGGAAVGELRAAAAPAASTPPEAPAFSTADEVIALERAFVRAWAAGDVAALDEMSAPGASRIWPDGTATIGFVGPCPPGLRVGPMSVRDLGDGALVSYEIRWNEGRSAETSVWTRTARTGLVLVHHQSTTVASPARTTDAPGAEGE